MIEPDHVGISVRRQCELVGLNRASYYYTPARESAYNLKLMRMIDEQYTRMTAYLRRQGHQVNPKRIGRLMRWMGLQAIYPQARWGKVRSEHKIYPYLLRGLKISRPNQVWSADITYIPMQQGYMYLVAVLDWFSRYVLAWELSNTQDGEFCLKVLREALRQGQPEIFNRVFNSQLVLSVVNWRHERYR
jgi:putative transposase